MPDRILELQRAASQPDAEVSSLLRKLLVVASELEVKELVTWAKLELNGFHGAESPEYREVRGTPSFSDGRGNMTPLVFKEAETMTALSERRIDQPISEIEHLVREKGVLAMNYPPKVLAALERSIPDMEYQGLPVLSVPRAQLVGIVDRVRTMIVEWTIALRRQGIRDSEDGFEKEERERAASITYNITSFQGVLGSVAGSNLEFGDFRAIEGRLREAGVPEEAISELREATAESKSSDLGTRERATAKAMRWLKEYGPLVGTLVGEIRSLFSHSQGGGT
jgi:AbiTii